MFYYHLEDHVYCAFYRDQAILLDLRQDKYYTLTEEQSVVLNKIITDDNFDINTENENQFNVFVKLLQDRNVLSAKKFVERYPYKIDYKNDSLGVEHIDWQLGQCEHFSLANIEILNAIWMLIKVNFWLRKKGFYSLIGKIRNIYFKNKACHSPSAEQLNKLVNSLNQACFFYPKQTKCLVWSVTLVLLALKKGWRINLVIGVQNYPFMAHAWVECMGEVILDNAELPKKMAVILKEPFRTRENES